jgi:hypothetical protein
MAVAARRRDGMQIRAVGYGKHRPVRTKGQESIRKSIL